jgi:hypothetical protein
VTILGRFNVIAFTFYCVCCIFNLGKREGCRLGMMRGIFRPKRKKLREGWRKIMSDSII